VVTSLFEDALLGVGLVQREEVSDIGGGKSGQLYLHGRASLVGERLTTSVRHYECLSDKMLRESRVSESEADGVRRPIYLWLSGLCGSCGRQLMLSKGSIQPLLNTKFQRQLGGVNDVENLNSLRRPQQPTAPIQTSIRMFPRTPQKADAVRSKDTGQ
jgi:5-methylcytosine-specific restriction endonuclease McrA